MKSASRRFLLSHAAFLSLLLAASSALAALNTGTQNVTGSRATPQYTDNGNNYGPYGWNYKYDRSFDGTKLNKHLEINFQFDAAIGWNAQQQADYKAAAKANVEGIWNGKASIKDNATNISYPITVELTTTGPFDQTVQVHKSTGPNDPTDMTNWYSAETAAGMAHEFGHMLSLFDEYIGGAVNQYPNPLLSNDGLMGLGALNANPVMYPRYYQQYLDYMNQLNPGGNFTLTVVPEPAAGLLFALGTLCLSAVRQRRRAA